VNVTNVRNINITNITNVNVTNVHYRYQTVAVTAMRGDAFRTSQPVTRNIVRVDPNQIARARIVPHPEIAPDRAAIRGGAPVVHPRAENMRPAVAERRPEMNAGRGAPAQPARNVPPSRPIEGRTANVPLLNENRQAAGRPPEPNQNRQEAGRLPSVAQRPSAQAPYRPSFVTRNAPPPARVPFEQRQPAMQEHPGRPLEPQQRANLREGRPAGPMQDREFPPHEQAQHAAAPHPQPHAQSRGEEQRH
jgi:hypothetical protein